MDREPTIAPPPPGEKTPAAVRVNGGRRVLDARVGMTLYAACRARKLFLPTGCGARGRCALCRVRALGDLAPPTSVEQAKLSAADLDGGQRLACQARIAGPAVELAVPDYAFDAREYAVTVERIEPLARDIRGLTLRLAEGDGLRFLAGQFMAFSVNPPPGLRGVVTRAYSLASPPSRSGSFDLIVRKVAGGEATTRVFEHLKVGDAAAACGPFGDFRLRGEDRRAVMIAGGSGLSPFLAMMDDLDDLARRGRARETILYFGAVNQADLYYVDRFQAFARERDWFQFVPALSGDETGHAYERGTIDRVLERTAGDLSGSDAYVCGSPGMVAACEKTLARLRLPADRLFYDRFA